MSLADVGTNKGRIMQFGTSRLLQAHVGLLVHEARQFGQIVGPITVVHSSGCQERLGRLDAFRSGKGYPIHIRGIAGGNRVERDVMVESVDSAYSVPRDWQDIVSIFTHEVGYVVSNTSERGFDLAAADHTPEILTRGHAPQSFPAMLLALLWYRWQWHGREITIMPSEPISRNGEVLKSIVLRLAEDIGAPPKFVGWLRNDVIWANTLVDRIVAGPLHPAGAVTEPYALWAIEKQIGVVPPCRHPAIVLADDITLEERLKLHTVNLGHTLLAEEWLKLNRNPHATVRSLLDDPALAGLLVEVLSEEVVPIFERYGAGARAEEYMDLALQRFRNPYLDHRLADIAQDHEMKVMRRIGNLLAWSADFSDHECWWLNRVYRTYR